MRLFESFIFIRSAPVALTKTARISITLATISLKVLLITLLQEPTI